MKKKILTQIMVISFALGGLFVVGNNVLADDTTTKPPGDQGGGGSGAKHCMMPGYLQVALAYRCDAPDSPTIPPRKCGEPLMSRWGRKLDLCW